MVPAVDGIADLNHHALFLDVDRAIKNFAERNVGREKTFATFVSSHNLIHNIGGEDDTNNNLTRRLLLLLESVPVGRPIAHQRVVKNILKRYLLEDRSFWRGTTEGHHIPHFLLNDFARLWRTIAVDFAYKLRARSGEKWAIRNIKLRMSRKLLYVAGLLACFRCHFLWDPEDRDNVYRDESLHPEIVDIIHSIFSDTPLDLIAAFLREHPHLDGTASLLFQAYDDFLGILRDPQQREKLETLTERAGSDPIYQNARDISHVFRDAILDLFFDEKLKPLTRLYGIF